MKHALLALGLLSLAGCSVPQLYKLEIQQGNYITEDMTARLKPGMTRNQVRFLLGTPLLVDVFHVNRWEYLYRTSRDGQVLEDRRFTVYFEGDSVTRFEGSVMPPIKGFVATDNALSPRQQTLEQAREAEIRKIQNEAKQDGADSTRKNTP